MMSEKERACIAKVNVAKIFDLDRNRQSFRHSSGMIAENLCYQALRNPFERTRES